MSEFKNDEEFITKREEFLEGISLIGIIYQPVFKLGDHLSNHYIFDADAFPAVRFEFEKTSLVPFLIQNECQQLFDSCFKGSVQDAGVK